MVEPGKVMAEKALALIPFGTFFAALGSVAQDHAPSLHWSQVFALICGGLASLAVCAYHIAKILRK